MAHCNEASSSVARGMLSTDIKKFQVDTDASAKALTSTFVNMDDRLNLKLMHSKTFANLICRFKSYALAHPGNSHGSQLRRILNTYFDIYWLFQVRVRSSPDIVNRLATTAQLEFSYLLHLNYSMPLIIIKKVNNLTALDHDLEQLLSRH